MKLSRNPSPPLPLEGEGEEKVSGGHPFDFAQDRPQAPVRGGKPPLNTPKDELQDEFMKLALSDITVLDLTWYIAGPYCTKLFADFGATVIKVERPGLGDPARHLGPFFRDDPHPEKGALFLHLNTNKKSVTLNLKNPRGQRLLKELVKRADIVVENFRPGVLPRLGLSYEELSAVNPGLVMVSISNFGQTGPYRDYEASEITLFAMSGAMIAEGAREREPLKYAGYTAQYFAGASAAAAALTAFTGARRHGISQFVDVSIFENALNTLSLEIERWIYSGDLPESVVARRPYFYSVGSFPLGIYPCQDGYVCFVGGAGRYLTRYCDLMGRPELMNDPRFSTREALQQNSDQFLALFLNWLADKSMDEAVDLAQAYRIPASPVNTIDHLFKERHLQARDYFVRIDHPVVGSQMYPGAHFRMPKAPFRPGRAPLLGEHNEEICGSILGYSRGELTLLRETGAM